MSIKKKIEAVGTPLKDWDIQINYGIKTGYNDAFIITTEKRNEILSNCANADERKRTEDLIRPILRGRDIKRYSYDWAGLWLIATFPSRHYDIDRYPAVRDYLLSFDKRVLAQTGEKKIDGNPNKNARKRTNNKWFETQDSISYWEDFAKPKVCWKRVGSILRFAYVRDYIFGLDSTCFMTGDDIAYICCILNSTFGHYLLKDSPKTGTGDLLISVQAVEPIKIPLSADQQNKLIVLMQKQLDSSSLSIDEQIDDIVYRIYGLTEMEISYIKDWHSQSQIIQNSD